MPTRRSRVDVLAGVNVAGPYGGDRLDWTTPTVVAADEPALVQPARVDETVVNAQRIEERFEALLRVGAPVDETHRIRWDDGDGEKLYEVRAVRRNTDAPHAVRHTHVVMDRVVEG